MTASVRDVVGERDRTAIILLGIVAAIATIWLMRAAAIVVVPLTAAFFIAIVVHPVQVLLHERLVGYPWVALPLTMVLILTIFGGAIWATAEALDEAAETAPRYAGQVQQYWRTLQDFARNNGLPIPEDVRFSQEMQQHLSGFASSVLRRAWRIASGLVLVLFLVVLMLMEARVWSRNMRRILREGQGSAAIEIVRTIAGKVRQYLFVRTVLGLVSAGVAGVWLLVLGVDLVLAWMVLIFALNYIPNFGSMIAVVPPSLMALVQHGPARGLIVLAGLTVFEQIVGNLIDPRMQGRRLHMSPVVVIVALVFWTWMWGPVGALLAVPVTVTLLSAAAHVPALQPVVTLLAGEGAADTHDRAAADDHLRSSLNQR